MDGRSSFVTGTNGCYIYSGSGTALPIPAGSLVLQSRSNLDRDIVMVTGSTPAERLRISQGGVNVVGTTTTGPVSYTHLTLPTICSV